MEHLMQRPLPGEIWSSTLLRSSRRSGLPIYALMRALTDRKWAPSFFHCGYVGDLAPLMRQDPRKVLWEHTILGYATAFYEPALRLKTLATVDSRGHAMAGAGVVVQGVSDYVRFRRFCSACARSDLAHWGESYWHVAHNLPGVLTCTMHQRRLLATTLPTAGPRSWSYALPHEVAGQPVTGRAVTCFQRELAKRSVSRICCPSAPEPARAPEWYRRALEERGWVATGRAVSGDALVQWFSGAVGPHPSVLGLPPKEADLKWVMLMIRPAIDIPFTPLKHLMLETALAVGHSSNAPSLAHKPSGMSKRPTAERDEQYAASVRALMTERKTPERSLRVSELLTELGCWSQFRHDRARFPLLSVAIKALRDKGRRQRDARSR